jgi:ATP-binding cassette, subfamily B, bacterial
MALGGVLRSPRALVTAMRARIAASGRVRAARLLWETSKGWALAVAGFAAASAVFPILVLVALGLVIGDLPGAIGQGMGSAGGHRLELALVFACAAYLANLLVGPWQDVLTLVVRSHLRDDLQNRLMAAVSEPIGVAHLEDPGLLGKLASARGQLLNVQPSDAPVTLALVLSSRLTGLLACVAVGLFRWWLGLAMLVVWLFVRAPLRAAQRGQVAHYRGGRDVFRRSYYLLDTAIGASAAKELRVFGLSDWIVGEYGTQWAKAIEVFHRGRMRFIRRFLVLFAPVLLAYLGGCAAVAWAGFHHEIGLGEVSILLGMLVTTSQVGAIGRYDLALEQMVTALPDVDELESELRGHAAALAGTRQAGGLPEHEIRFEGVSFRYPRSDADVLAGLELVVPVGRSTAIVGLNGAGKTTLVKLLSRLHDPSAGRIVIDGIPLTGLDPGSWQRQVSVVNQDFTRYPLSARENVGFGAPAHLDDEAGIIATARQAGALGFIEALPLGWDTVLSREYSGGADLSGGQWQRVALARALFAVRHGARVLVLDEPTAWLDVRAEAEFFDRFLEITSGATTIVISHRFSTVRRAEQICVLDGGRIVERGTHEALVAGGGHYAAMFLVQAARFTGPAPEAVHPEAVDPKAGQ